MSPEAQRTAIAEACGFSNVRRIGSTLVGDRTPPIPNDSPCGIPNYLNDLNAMHEAEATLDFVQFNRYHADLWGIVGNRDFAFESCAPLPAIRRFTSATAAQRAEAFLHTIGKWEGDK